MSSLAGGKMRQQKEAWLLVLMAEVKKMKSLTRAFFITERVGTAYRKIKKQWYEMFKILV